MGDLGFPYRVTRAGRTARSKDHLREMIAQVLFTSPGERVNRPDFGAGLMGLVFSPDGDELVAATQVMVQGALQQWLGDLIEVEQVLVETEEETLVIGVHYRERTSGRVREARFERP